MIVEFLYKFCAVGDAHFIEAGNVKIGTLSSYAALESERADPDEGSLYRHVQSAVLEHDSLDPAVRDFMARQTIFGVPVGGSVALQNCVFREQAPDACCFCMTWDPRAEAKNEGPQALFKIHRPGKLGELLVRLLYPMVDGMGIDPVSYGDRHVSLQKGMGVQANAFLKPRKFEWEKEMRMIFRTGAGYGPATITTGPNAQLAAHFERIR